MLAAEKADLRLALHAQTTRPIKAKIRTRRIIPRKILISISTSAPGLAEALQVSNHGIHLGFTFNCGRCGGNIFLRVRVA
jgi:hypothetical protein